MPEVDLGAEIGPPMRTILQRIAGPISEEQLDALLSAFRQHYDSEGWKNTPCFPHARESLQAMKEHGHRLFVVSNKPSHIAPKILEREGVLSLFDEIYTRDGRTPAFSGKSEMISVLLHTHDLRSADCIMVGDTLEDGEAATMHSIPFILMTHGYGKVPADGQVPVAARLTGFEEFLPLLAMEA
jgi:phosphoglycolate phosphatase